MNNYLLPPVDPFCLAAAKILQCPRCGCASITHISGRIIDRIEDGESASVTALSRDNPTTVSLLQHDYSGNPSLRRHGLTIQFECEACGPGIILAIAQHKGNTLIGWQDADGIAYPWQAE